MQETSGARRHDAFFCDVSNRLQIPLISTHSVKVNHTFFICITIPITILEVLIHSFCFSYIDIRVQRKFLMGIKKIIEFGVETAILATCFL